MPVAFLSAATSTMILASSAGSRRGPPSSWSGGAVRYRTRSYAQYSMAHITWPTPASAGCSPIQAGPWVRRWHHPSGRMVPDGERRKSYVAIYRLTYAWRVSAVKSAWA